MIKNLIINDKKGRVLGLILLAAAGISAGCSTSAQSKQTAEPASAKKDAPVAAATTPTAAPPATPSVKAPPSAEAQRRFDGDFESDMEYSTPAPEVKTKSSAVKINRAAFDKIKPGMSLAEVEKLIGDKGMLVGTNIVNGRTKYIYKFSDDNFSSYIDVTIENGKVADKADKNLK